MPHDRIGLEVRGRVGAHRAAEHRCRTLGLLGSGDGRPAGERRRRAVPVLLDAAVRAGGSLAVAARDGLGGAERREHGDAPSYRAGLRPVEAADGFDTYHYKYDSGREGDGHTIGFYPRRCSCSPIIRVRR